MLGLTNTHKYWSLTLPLPLLLLQAVKGLFEQYGPVVNMHMVTDRATGQPRNFCFVTMGSPELAQVCGCGCCALFCVTYACAFVGMRLQLACATNARYGLCFANVIASVLGK